MSTLECYYSPDGTLDLAESEVNHIVNAKRHKIGDKLEVVDGAGLRMLTRIISIKPFALELISQERLNPSTPQFDKMHITLALAVTKGDRFNQAVEMAVELGVDAIIPWISERTVVKYTSEQHPKFQSKLENLVVAAAKQSRRAYFPEVHELVNTKNLLHQISQQANLVPVVLFEHSVVSFYEYIPPNSADILLIVGPEGGITDPEIVNFRDAGAKDYSLGDTILRTGTAVAKGLSILSRYRSN